MEWPHGRHRPAFVVVVVVVHVVVVVFREAECVYDKLICCLVGAIESPIQAQWVVWGWWLRMRR